VKAQIQLYAEKDKISKLITGLDLTAKTNLYQALLKNDVHMNLFESADQNSDGSISKTEFTEWMESVKHEATPSLTRRQNQLVAIRTSLPMIGFGFLDNAIMILAGDAIDIQFGVTLGISTMAAAGLGNLVSDVAGLGLSGYIETIVSKLGVPSPQLSRAQLESPAYRRISNLFKIIGISVGCLIGMAPLLFLNTSEDKHQLEKLRVAFDAIDKNNTGFIEAHELAHMFSQKEMHVTPNQTHDFLVRYNLSEDQRLSFEEFVQIDKRIRCDLKNNQPIFTPKEQEQN